MDPLPISRRRTMKAKADGAGDRTPRKRVRRGIESWRTLILQQRASGEPVEAFCGARGIPRSSFSKWRNRLESAPAAQFLPVAVRSAGAGTAGLGERRDKAKLLWWHHTGFLLLYKRLERSRFPDPRALAARGLSMAEVMAFLEGIDLSRARRIAPVPASRVA